MRSDVGGEGNEPGLPHVRGRTVLGACPLMFLEIDFFAL